MTGVGSACWSAGNSGRSILGTCVTNTVLVKGTGLNHCPRGEKWSCRASEQQRLFHQVKVQELHITVTLCECSAKNDIYHCKGVQTYLKENKMYKILSSFFLIFISASATKPSNVLDQSVMELKKKLFYL